MIEMINTLHADKHGISNGASLDLTNSGINNDIENVEEIGLEVIETKKKKNMDNKDEKKEKDIVKERWIYFS